MQSTLALVALAAVAYAAPQGVTADITPAAAAPAGFATTYPGSFQITAVNTTVVTAKRDISKRDACPTTEGALVITLTNGVLTDSKGRTGYIASNFQFQFDGPPQDGAIYTGGFSVGSNSSLALGGSAVFFECLSGGFYNLYNEDWAAQCEPVLIDILPCGGTAATSAVVTQASDGQPAGTSVGTAISQISDGQPQAQSAIPITQISDGQPQVPTAVISQISDGQIQQPTVAISQISDGQIQATTAAVPISQISDGQIQATTSAAVAISQISDGQIQATTAPAAISQISDGQIQATTATAVPISQISDGQIQATTSAAVAISQISDGQIQATTAAPATLATSAAAPISQISDGQIQAPNSTAPAASPSVSVLPVTGLANTVSVGGGFVAAVLGLMAVILL